MATPPKHNKKKTPPGKKPVHKKSAKSEGKPAAKKKDPELVKKQFKLNRLTAIIVALLGFLIYANTIGHEYVLDDFSVIRENKIVVQGTKAIGKIFNTAYREGNYTHEDKLYRPLTKVMFATEYDIMDGDPQLSHFINILLYGLLCGFIFLWMMRFFPGKYYLALITTLLFTIHPIHTEVVANIKSRDEIMTLFFLLGSLWMIKTYVVKKKTLQLAGGLVLYFLALLTKESAITYMALLPLSLYFFTKLKPRQIATITGAALVVTVSYLIIHFNVVGSIGLKNIPVPDNSIMESQDFMVQRMTAIFFLGMYLKLLVFPHPLSCDYSFNTYPLVESFGNPVFLLSLLLHIGMLVIAIRGLKQRSIWSYAIFFYLITLSIVSNIFTLIGTNLAERLIFMPSFGFCIAIAYGLVKLLKIEKTAPLNFSEVFTKKSVLWIILVPILLAGGYKTIDRNKDWKNVSTLFTTDLKTVPNSVHMLLYHVGVITNKDSLALQTPEQKQQTLEQAEKELIKAVNLWEPFPNAHASLGRVYKEMGRFDEAIREFRRTLQLNANDPTTFNNFATCFFSIGQLDSAEINFKHAAEISPICYTDALCNLGSVYGTKGEIMKQQGDYDQASQYFSMAIQKFEETLQCDENYANAYRFLGATYQNLGDSAKAIPYLQKFQELDAQKQQQLTQ